MNTRTSSITQIVFQSADASNDGPIEIGNSCRPGSLGNDGYEIIGESTINFLHHENDIIAAKLECHSLRSALEGIKSFENKFCGGRDENDRMPYLLEFEIDISSCSIEIEDDGIKAIATELFSLTERNDINYRVRELIVPGMSISQYGLDAITSILINSWHRCEVLSLSYNYLTNKGIEKLSNALQHNFFDVCKNDVFKPINKPTSSGLKTLKLENVGMNYVGIEHLRNSFNCNDAMQSLNELYLGDNDFFGGNNANHGVRQIKLLLRENPNIHTLSLFATNLGDDALSSLAYDFQSRRSLHLGRNNITCKGVAILGKIILNSSTLQNLKLNGNPVGDNSDGWFSFTESLKENSSLKYLDLTNCKIEDDGAISLAKNISINTSLEQVILRGNYGIGEAGIGALIQCLFDTTSLQHVLNSNHTLVNFDFYSSMVHIESSRELKSLCEINQQLGRMKSRKQKFLCGIKTNPWWISCWESENHHDRKIIPYLLEMLTSGQQVDMFGTTFNVLRNVPLILKNLIGP
mmetsp:Transcript_2325/g.5023  ORF Transcript_2325/g.5023 Transcript_2325/m.5023 type:complete len:522 (-) Transcript_2325:207-1772(-)